MRVRVRVRVRVRAAEDDVETARAPLGAQVGDAQNMARSEALPLAHLRPFGQLSAAELARDRGSVVRCRVRSVNERRGVAEITGRVARSVLARTEASHRALSPGEGRWLELGLGLGLELTRTLSLSLSLSLSLTQTLALTLTSGGRCPRKTGGDGMGHVGTEARRPGGGRLR